MTLESIVRKRLNEDPATSGRHDWTYTDEAAGWTVHVTTERRDEWSAVAWEVSLRRAKAQGELAAWAQRLASQIGLEPFKVIEVDSSRNQAIVRSERPTVRDGRVLYYELLVNGASSAILRRFEATHDPGEKRRQVAFAIPNEALAKLIADLAV